jgi:sugar O-acyltransferase (sialic acid O-acetyltransferase NeuD family)
MFVAIGALRHMLLREKLLQRLASEAGHSAISSKAYQAPSAKLGSASVICPFVCLHSNVQVGSGAVIFSGSVIEHDCVVGNNVNIGPGVAIAGSVTIDDNVFVGAGVTIKDGIAVGRNSVIGAGSVVVRDVPPNMIVYGNPARGVRSNDLYRAV